MASGQLQLRVLLLPSRYHPMKTSENGYLFALHPQSHRLTMSHLVVQREVSVKQFNKSKTKKMRQKKVVFTGRCFEKLNK